MDQDGIVVSDFMLELTDCLQEWLTLNISNRSADLNDRDMCIVGCEVAVKSALDFVCDMRDYLNGASTIITTTFFLKNGPVYFSGCNI